MAALSPAQRVLLERAARCPFGLVDVRGLRTAESLARLGLMKHLGSSRTLSCAASFQITDSGRAAVAQEDSHNAK